MTWREATAADCPLLGVLNHQLVADENHPNKMDVAVLTERMRGFLAGDYTAILFEQDDAVVAYALFHPHEDNEIYFRQFFVVRERRREGLGRQAVRHLVEEVFPSDKRIVLTALSGNERALAFWGAVGFDKYCVSFERLPMAPQG